MNWKELFEDPLAEAGHLVGAIDEAGDHVTLVEAPVGEVLRVVREALLADVMLERVARGIHASHDRGEDFDDEPQSVQDEYLDMARAALVVQDEYLDMARAALAAAMEGRVR